MIGSDAGRVRGADWQPCPELVGSDARRLWSLWDMQVLRAKDLMQLMYTLYAAELKIRNKTGPVSDDDKLIAKQTREATEKVTRSLELPVSERMALYIDVRSYKALHRSIEATLNTFSVKIEQKKYYGPLVKYSGYFEATQLFGDVVFNAFLSANDDIFEAGTCLALERATACVMHLNRALECALSALSKAVGVGKHNDWGSYIREIRKELDARADAAGGRSADEQFYAEAGANFDRLRRAYRNPTMHPEKTYSQDRAEEILLATRSFMVHLAIRLSE